MEAVRAVADECVIGLLADLLDAGSSGISAGVLVDSMAEFVEANLHELPDLVVGLIPGGSGRSSSGSRTWGVVTTAGENVTLTPAGVTVSIGLVEDAGVQVLVRPDPATCDASAVVDLLGAVEEQDRTTDVSAWLAARPDPVTAAGERPRTCATSRSRRCGSGAAPGRSFAHCPIPPAPSSILYTRSAAANEDLRRRGRADDRRQ
jgi:hypothetical protein